YSAKEPLPHPPPAPGFPLRLLSSSQIKANKGHAELARTLAALRDRGFPFHWDVAGTGAALDDLLKLCRALNLEERVTFHGFQRNLSPLLRACDVFVLPSYQEGLPNTLLEAMAHGLTPVARAVGGVAECWPPGLSDLLIPPETLREQDGPPDPGALPLFAPLRKVLSATAGDIHQWKRLAWEHCARNFSLASQAEKLEAFFLDRLRALPA
ncbi:MAG: glycosyltransferase, partial [Desulfovibrio sp.]|nr:glycosyltransferase [Desulfovibrio sp.]